MRTDDLMFLAVLFAVRGSKGELNRFYDFLPLILRVLLRVRLLEY